MLLDPQTFLPNHIHFKNLNESLQLEVGIVYFKGHRSNSGAYLFAPYSGEENLKLMLADANLVETALFDQILLSYHCSLYPENPESTINITLTLSHLSAQDRVLGFKVTAPKMKDIDLMIKVKVVSEL